MMNKPVCETQEPKADQMTAMPDGSWGGQRDKEADNSETEARLLAFQKPISKEGRAISLEKHFVWVCT
jgi:hypothetical protein